MKTSDNFLTASHRLEWIALMNPKSGQYNFVQVTAGDAEKKGIDYYRLKSNCEKETKRLSEL